MRSFIFGALSRYGNISYGKPYRKSQSAINIRLISISSQPHISHTCMSPHGNASCGGAEDPEATQVGDLGVDAREAGGAHGA